MPANTTFIIPQLDTDLSVAPYYEDFDPKKNYKRIVAVPSLALQARDITQIQSMIQFDQAVYMSHFFKDGSKVKGGDFKLDLTPKFLRLKNLNNFGNTVNVTNFDGKIVSGGTSNVAAYVVTVSSGTEEAFPDTKTLIIKYTNSGGSNSVASFVGDETITSNNGFTAVTTANNYTGNASIFTITEGYVFAKGFPVRFDTQTVILDKYTNKPSARVGFNISESIVTSNEDATLNDPAAGFPNYTAPGYHRVKLTANLVSYELTANTPTSFVELLQIKDGVVQELSDRPQYADIRDEFARRTFDESGDYVVNGFNVRVKSHLDTDEVDGYLTLENGGNTELLAIGIEPGVAYVKGYDYRNLITRWMPADKGIDYKDVAEVQVSANYGNYVLVKEACGVWDVNLGAKISIYDSVESKITNRTFSTGAPSGNKIGEARVRHIMHHSGNIGTASAQYKLYLYDINISNSEFSSARSVYLDNSSGTSDAIADIVLTSNNATLYESQFNSSILPIPLKAIRRIRDSSGTVNSNYEFLKSFAVSIGTNGQFTINTGLSNETFPYSAGLLNDTQKTTKFMVIMNTATNISLTGTVSGSTGNTVITGSGTAFTTELNPGDDIKIGSDIYTVNTITNNTTLSTTSTLSNTYAGSSFKKHYAVGKIIDFSGEGATNVERTININSSTSATFDMKETFDASSTATVICSLNKANVQEKKKVLRSNRYVKINCGTHAATNVGPWCLGVSDLFKINSIRSKASAFTASTDGADITDSFIIDYGARDSHYGLAWISLAPGASLASGTYLLIDLDYFDHDTTQGLGYCSVDSYPIDDVNTANTAAIQTKEIPRHVSSITGVIYDLRDCIDFRPKETNTASNSTTVGSASSNPSSTTTIESGLGGLHYIHPNESFNMDLSYYLPRRDLIIMESTGNYKILRGVPGIYPVTPSTPDNAMALASVYIPQYPSLTPDESKALNRLDYSVVVSSRKYKRYTMRDIGAIDQNLKNMMYYTMLNTLEKKAADLKILDADGLDRFKNGILVDAFTGTNIADVGSIEFKCAIDPKEKECRPLFDLNSITVDYDSGSSTNITKTGPLLSLPYTETTFIEQPYASTVKNSSGYLYNWIGAMELYPSEDFWVNIERAPELRVNIDNNADAWLFLANNMNPSPWSTQWNDWQTLWTGQNSITRDVGTWWEDDPSDPFHWHNLIQQITTTTNIDRIQERTGIRNGFVASDSEQSLGDRVIDASLLPYMRPRTIVFVAHGLKPDTTFYAFFDGVDVTEYCGKLTYTFSGTANTSFVSELGNFIIDESLPTGIQINSNEEAEFDFNNLAPLVSDSNGMLVGVFKLPCTDARKFTVGTKRFRLTDNLTNDQTFGNVTSSAEAQYSASGMQQSKQNTIISSKKVSIAQVQVSEQKHDIIHTVDVSRSTISTTYTPDPIVQNIRINIPVEDLNTEISGVFVTKIDLYFQSKHATLPITIDIREMDNASSVSNRIVPLSRVVKYPNDINVSNDASEATTFRFSSVVFLKNNVDYAIHIQPAANNPDYRLWTAKLGGVDTLTEANISVQPYVGVMLASSNDTNWNIIQDEDLKFTLYRASFNTGVTGTARFNNSPIEYMTTNTEIGVLNTADEPIYGETRLVMSSPTGTVSVGQKAYQATSNAVGIITYVSGNNIRIKDVGLNNKFAAGQTVTYKYANNTATGVTSGTTSVSNPKGYRLYNLNNTLHVYDTNNVNFIAGEQIIGQYSNSSAIIESLDEVKVNVLQPAISQLNFISTSLDWSAKLTSNSGVLQTTWNDIINNDNNYMDDEMLIYSNSEDDKSLQLRAIMRTGTNYLSPVIDTDKMHCIAVANIINNDSTGETNPNGGNAKAKYLHKKVVLRDNQDAEDLQVRFSAYYPSTSQIKVYYKILNTEDGSILNDIDWTEMESTKTSYSNIENMKDFIEYSYVIPTAQLTGPNEEVQYTNPDGITFTGFKVFVVKVVLLGSNSSRVPRIKDFQVLALQK